VDGEVVEREETQIWGESPSEMQSNARVRESLV